MRVYEFLNLLLQFVLGVRRLWDLEDLVDMKVEVFHETFLEPIEVIFKFKFRFHCFEHDRQHRNLGIAPIACQIVIELLGVVQTLDKFFDLSRDQKDCTFRF